MALCFPLRNMAQMASTYTTLTVTVERYLVILLPLKASAMWTYGKTRRAIIGVLLFSVIFNLPRCFDNILSNPSASSSGAGVSESSSLNLSSPLSWGDRLPDSAYLGLVSQGASGSDVSDTGNTSCVNMRSDVSKHHNGSNAEWSNQSQTVSPPGNLTDSGLEREGEGGEGGSVSEGLNYFYRVVYQFYLTVIFLYLIPYTLIPVLNLQLVMALRRRREETRRISVKNEHRLNGLSGSSSPTDKEEGELATRRHFPIMPSLTIPKEYPRDEVTKVTEVESEAQGYRLWCKRQINKNNSTRCRHLCTPQPRFRSRDPP